MRGLLCFAPLDVLHKSTTVQVCLNIININNSINKNIKDICLSTRRSYINIWR
jgi:hypothetical protein